eukprot:4529616-Pyramimonas_sp.AAC.2
MTFPGSSCALPASNTVRSSIKDTSLVGLSQSSAAEKRTVGLVGVQTRSSCSKAACRSVTIPANTTLNTSPAGMDPGLDPTVGAIQSL